MRTDWLSFVLSHGVPQLVDRVLIFSGLDAGDVLQARLVCRRYNASVEAFVLQRRSARAVFNQMIEHHGNRLSRLINGIAAPADDLRTKWPPDYWADVQAALRVIIAGNNPMFDVDVQGAWPPTVRVYLAESLLPDTMYFVSRDLSYIRQYVTVRRGEQIHDEVKRTCLEWRGRFQRNFLKTRFQTNRRRSRAYKELLSQLLLEIDVRFT